MKIGELAQRCGATTRQLRYYESQGLLTPQRTQSNYRDYDETSVETVRQIRCLIESGMPTRIIRVLIPCVAGPAAELPAHYDPDMANLLEAERDRLAEQIRHLAHSKKRIECYLNRVNNQPH